MIVDAQCIPQPLRVYEVHWVKLLSEPVIYWREQIVGVLTLVLLLPQTSQAACIPSYQGVDILIEAEHIRRIILLLQGQQPFILRHAIGLLDPLATFVVHLP